MIIVAVITCSPFSSNFILMHGRSLTNFSMLRLPPSDNKGVTRITWGEVSLRSSVSFNWFPE